MARKEKRDDLILYMGILKSGTVLASFSNKDSSLDKIVLEASTEVPELCRTYSMVCADFVASSAPKYSYVFILVI